MAVIDEPHEIGGGAVATGRSEVAKRLVAPRGVEWVLGNRQQFEMGVAKVLRMRRQLGRQLAIGQPAVAFLRHPHPRPEVHFVDRHRLVLPVEAPARLAPGGVVPGIVVDHGNDGRRIRAQLEGKPVGIGLETQMSTVPRLDLELVALTFAEPGDEQLPDPRYPAHAHHVAAPVPAIEVADDADPLRVRSPYAEVHPRNAIDFAHVRPELLVFLVVRALADEVEIEVGQPRRERVGIAALLHFPRRVGKAQAIFELVAGPRHTNCEQTSGMNTLHRDGPIAGQHHIDVIGVRQVGTYRNATIAAGVWTQHLKRIPVPGFDDAPDLFGGQSHLRSKKVLWASAYITAPATA